ncbi:hypothetical protein PCE1_002563 [Barthelona sp. PCE]
MDNLTEEQVPTPLVEEVEDENVAPAQTQGQYAPSFVSYSAMSDSSFAMSFTSELFGSEWSLDAKSERHDRTAPASESDLTEDEREGSEVGFTVEAAAIEHHEITEEDLEKVVQLTLSESDIQTILHIPMNLYSTEDKERLVRITDNNERYEKKREEYSNAPDLLEEGCVQTMTNPLIDEGNQTAAVKTVERGKQVNEYDLYVSEIGGVSREEVAARIVKERTKRRRAALSGGNTLDEDEEVVMDAEWEYIKGLESFKDNLNIFENIISSNYYRRLATNMQSFNPEYINEHGEVTTVPSCEPLFTLKVDTIKEKLEGCHCETTAIMFNPANPNLFAQALGTEAVTDDSTGYVVLWNLRNLLYPERIFRFPSSVFSIDFSKDRPYLLCVGLSNGTVTVIDIRTGVEAFTTANDADRCTWPVWSVHFLNAKDKDPCILFSSGGKSYLYYYLKARVLENMTFKITFNPKRAEKKQDGFISRLVDIFTIDVLENDNTTYIAGTSGGIIHECSINYNEQFLSSFYGHTEPVYKVKYSSLTPNYFVSCAEDWSIRVWNSGNSENMAVLNSINTQAKSAVLDVEWCPIYAGLLASCTANGFLEFWDLSQPISVPVFSDRHPQSMSKVRFTRVVFNGSYPILMAGDSVGNLHCYKLKGVEDRREYYKTPENLDIVEEKMATALKNAMQSGINASTTSF